MIDAPPSAVQERYQLLRRLGQGGYGMVYEALDRSSGERVALKELTAVNALSLAHFKHEFRAMQEVHHPNLVRLDALFEDGGKWLIAMELVEGTDLLNHLYVDAPETCFDERQLRDVFRQLADGLEALHTAGFIHRDLKPENVRITHDERVVLLDFGLATGIDPHAQATRFTGLGTLSYMAPEQADRLKVGPAADWYAFGVCLYQALTGVLPIDGTNPLTVLLAKQQTPAPRASTQASGVPEDLDELCDSLLQIAPADRPDGRVVRKVLSGDSQPRVWFSGKPPSIKPVGQKGAFEGREHELGQLEQALARARLGKPQVVLVEGDSGIGKSCLVEHFITRPRGGLCLRSRCYESELLAYKAFDGAIYELTTYLCRRPRAEREALMPERAALLRRLFPALEAVDTIASAPLRGVTPDPTLQRFEAFGVFARLLGRLGVKDPVMLVIDDLQWADAESFALLQALLSVQTLSCLVLATVRPRSELEGDAATGIAALRQLPCVRDLPLSGLPAMSALGLARRLTGSSMPDAWLELIVKESAGHPLFLMVLTRFAGSQDPRMHADITLDLAISTHIGGLTRKARRLLDTVAIAGAPLPAALCARAAGIAEVDLGRLTTELCRQKLLRRRQAGQIACFHDRIRTVAVACLPEADARTLHAKLAAALATLTQVDPAEIARHHEAAGELGLAYNAFAQGAKRALSALAFARAALLYGRAFEIATALGLPDAERRSLLCERGHALARCGRSAEAARRYLQAANLATGEDKTHLRIWAAQHLLQSACVEEGMAAAHALLVELDLPVPSGTPSTLARMAWDRAVLRMRGLDVVSAKGTIGTQARMQLDALWGLSLPIAWLDPLKGAALTTHHLRLSRSCREPAHMARALAEEAFARQFSDPHDPAIDRLLQRSRSLCDSMDDPALDVRVSYREGAIAGVRWDLARAIERLEHSHRVATERCPDQPWLLTNVRLGLGPIWVATGQHGKLATLSSAWLAEARERNDQFALSLLETLGGAHLRHLMDDEPDRARVQLQQAVAPWPREPFSFTHFGEAMAITFIELYRGGDGAHAWFTRELPRLSKAFMMRVSFGQATQLAWQALACIAACSGKAEREAVALRNQARAHTAALGKLDLRIADLHRALIDAQLAALEDDVEVASVRMKEALELSERFGYMLIHHTARYLQGVMEGGETGAARRQAAIATFEHEGWRVPRNAVRMMCPALDLLERG